MHTIDFSQKNQSYAFLNSPTETLVDFKEKSPNFDNRSPLY
jgi:hypothetical protein